MSDSTPLTLLDARHLLRRTGFGATVAAAQDLVTQYVTRGAAADHLLDFTPSRFRPGGRYIENVHAKWVKYMTKTRLVLQEKLVLFWHDHFATSYDKVGDVKQMANQNRLLRTFCNGNFRAFVKAINKDPAMMEMLDTVRNDKDEPNENYARELQELFTLGVKDPLGNPNYEQADIVQIARAFTGWDYDNSNIAFLRHSDHDKGDAIEAWSPPRGPKVIYKTRGGFNDLNGQSFDAGTNYEAEIDNVIDIILQHRYGPSGNQRGTTADYIAQKLITYFAHPSPSTSYVQAVVDTSGFASSFELTPLLKAIFVHDDFYISAAPPAAGTVKSVKWPIDYAVTTLRTLGMKLRSKYQYVNGGDYAAVRDQLTNMGQTLLEPPSVFGWDWETAWLSSSTLLARYNFARDLTSARSSGGTSFRPEQLIDLSLTDPGAIVDAVTTLLGIDDQIGSAERDAVIDYLTDGAGPSATVDLADDDLRERKLNGLVATVLQSPIYQLH
jgi:uncharacterized protein (DUF1800 family)